MVRMKLVSVLKSTMSGKLFHTLTNSFTEEFGSDCYVRPLLTRERTRRLSPKFQGSCRVALEWLQLLKVENND